jgi:hypothetical protein
MAPGQSNAGHVELQPRWSVTQQLTSYPAAEVPSWGHTPRSNNTMHFITQRFQIWDPLVHYAVSRMPPCYLVSFRALFWRPFQCHRIYGWPVHGGSHILVKALVVHCCSALTQIKASCMAPGQFGAGQWAFQWHMGILAAAADDCRALVGQRRLPVPMPRSCYAVHPSHACCKGVDQITGHTGHGVQTNCHQRAGARCMHNE